MIPTSVKIISDDSFNRCISLNGTLTIPASDSQISRNAFAGTAFWGFYFAGTQEPKCEDAIGLPDGAVEKVFDNYTRKSFCSLGVNKISDKNVKKSKGLSKGSIVANVISFLVVVSAIVVATLFLVKKYKTKDNFELMSSLSKNEANDIIGSV